MYTGQAAPDEPEEAAEEEEIAEEELAPVRVSEKEFSFLDYEKRYAVVDVYVCRMPYFCSLLFCVLGSSKMSKRSPIPATLVRPFLNLLLLLSLPT